MLKLSYHYSKTRRQGLAGRDSQAGTITVSEPIKNNQLESFSLNLNCYRMLRSTVTILTRPKYALLLGHRQFTN